MPSSHWESIDGQTTSGVACHHCLWAQTFGRRRAKHAIIAFGQHTRSNDVRRGMPTSPLGSTQDRTMSGIACHHAICQHTRSDDVGRGMPSLPLKNTDDRLSSGVACHHGPWTAHTVNNIGRGMISPPLDSTHGQTSGVTCDRCL